MQKLIKTNKMLKIQMIYKINKNKLKQNPQIIKFKIKKILKVNKIRKII